MPSQFAGRHNKYSGLQNLTERNMNMKTLWQNLSRTMITAFPVLALVALPAYAADTSAGPLSIQASLITPEQITLGEPILVRYKIANDSGQRVAAHLGNYGTDWYTLTMRDAQGVAVTAMPDPRPSHPQGAHSTQNGFFHDGQTSTDYIPVTKRLSIQHPGQYTLTIHVNLPYAVDDTSVEGASDALATASGLMQTQDITFPILVTKADPIRLRTTAEALRKASLNGLNGTLARAELAALFSMPEAQAASSWRALALNPGLDTDAVASELAELHSNTGTDILAEMADLPALNCTPISDRLNRLYNTGTPTLREHIKAIARQRGFEMPEVAGTPYVPKDEEPSPGGITF